MYELCCELIKWHKTVKGVFGVMYTKKPLILVHYNYRAGSVTASIFCLYYLVIILRPDLTEEDCQLNLSSEIKCFVKRQDCVIFVIFDKMATSDW